MQVEIMAYLHYLGIMSLAATQTASLMIIRVSDGSLKLLRVIECLTLTSWLMLLVSGMYRLSLEKGMAYYGSSLFFHAKMGVFTLMSFCILAGSFMLFRQKASSFFNAEATLDADRKQTLRRFWRWSTHLLPLLPLFAVLMANGYGIMDR